MKTENEGYIIEVKGSVKYASVERFREVAETVAQHRGWRFLLVTGDDVSPNEPEQKSEKLLSWRQILSRKAKGENLFRLGEYEGAFLSFWGILEAMMRKRAEQASLPIERFPTSALMKHLYSQGELSVEQFDTLMKLLKTRNEFVHGFQARPLKGAAKELEKTVNELAESWHPS